MSMGRQMDKACNKNKKKYKNGMALKELGDD
jgi:hypothetical protein